MNQLSASSLRLGSCQVDEGLLKKISQACCGHEAATCDTGISIKVSKKEVPEVVYEWTAQDSWKPIHFTKVRIQIFGFQPESLVIQEIAKNRTLVRLSPSVSQISVGSQEWNSKASRCMSVKWQRGFPAQTENSTIPIGLLPEKLSEELANDGLHEFTLKHNVQKVRKLFCACPEDKKAAAATITAEDIMRRTATAGTTMSAATATTAARKRPASASGLESRPVKRARLGSVFANKK
eukprot:TRINITY_DN10772_c0_g1_i1.p1 TRINITY_DN10772_c0_g1~~TRINITY_DN10772_c0_g1_i1.p1  ORF type:complete len:237 (-),score=36.89 TRINITY_DN10772_c0_g1_i1:81-791(-)